MYAMMGKLIAQPNKREELVDILKQASNIVGEIQACRLYLIHEDTANETDVWIYELWEDKEAHDLSLKDERVRELISQAMPLLGGAPAGTELRLAGGHGM